jgi:uncharacterized membrane protein YagU involved in acid resistance
VVLYRVGPVVIYQSVASGLLGRSSFQGGLRTAALGMFLHFFIALTAATVFVLASQRIPLLSRKPVPSGLLFGVSVYLFMHYVVVPLSEARGTPFSPAELIGHAFLVGLPIAYAARDRGRGV